MKTRGYVSDVITDAAIEFIRAHQGRPFFTYLAFNAPHTPLQVPAEKQAKYTRMNLQAADFAGPGHPIAPNFNPDVTAQIYGMIENIDDNVGRVLTALDSLKLTERTVVIFLTDNGPQQPRSNAGLGRLKGTVYEGGIRVPFFVRWPGVLAPRVVDRIAAHIDLTPTLIDIAGVTKPRQVTFDGRSLAPLFGGDGANWPDRTLFFQWHRGDAPEMYRAFAARSQRYKLIQPEGSGGNALPSPLALQLYDMTNDAFEQRNVAAEHPEVVARMKRQYEDWFGDVTSGRDYTDRGVARIGIGAPQENPVRLTRQDWRGPLAAWTRTGLGHWEVDVHRAGAYHVTLRFASLSQPGTVSFALGERKLQKEVAARATTVTFSRVRIARGTGRLESWVTQGDSRIGMLDVVVQHLR